MLNAGQSLASWRQAASCAARTISQGISSSLPRRCVQDSSLVMMRCRLQSGRRAQRRALAGRCHRSPACPATFTSARAAALAGQTIMVRPASRSHALQHRGVRKLFLHSNQSGGGAQGVEGVWWVSSLRLPLLPIKAEMVLPMQMTRSTGRAAWRRSSPTLRRSSRGRPLSQPALLNRGL